MLIRICDWPNYLEEGEKYLALAQGASERRRDVFTPNIIYNITAMAIEKLLMGFLMYNGSLAENHTMRDLLSAVERITGPQPHLTDDFSFLDSFQEICSLESFQRHEPTWEDIPRILACGKTVREYVDSAVIMPQATASEDLCPVG